MAIINASAIAAQLTVPAAVADILFPHQLKQIADIRAALLVDIRRILAQAPTGSGKTFTFVVIAMLLAAAGYRVVIIGTRTRIIRQIHQRLEAFGVDHGVIAAALPEFTKASALVQVASADTLFRRCIVSRRRPPFRSGMAAGLQKTSSPGHA